MSLPTGETGFARNDTVYYATMTNGNGTPPACRLETAKVVDAEGPDAGAASILHIQPLDMSTEEAARGGRILAVPPAGVLSSRQLGELIQGADLFADAPGEAVIDHNAYMARLAALAHQAIQQRLAERNRFSSGQFE